MTELISRWRRERLPAVRLRNVPKQVAGSYPCPGLAGCIIATIWLPESVFRSVLDKAEDIRQEKCACRLGTMCFPVLCGRQTAHRQEKTNANATAEFGISLI